MTHLNHKKWLFLFFTVFFSISLAISANAQDVGGGKKKCKPCPKLRDYVCVGDCPGELQEWWWEPCCNSRPDWIQRSSTGAVWQHCDAGGASHSCSGGCLAASPANYPENPRWYDDQTKNNDPAADKGNKNNTLPIVLDWTLNSWKDGGQYEDDGTPRLFAAPNYGSNSFYIEIDNPNDQLLDPDKVPGANYDANKKVFSKCIHNDFFNSRKDGAPCFFRQGKTINYRVKACCTSDCNDCGPFVEWNFSTGDFPEPKEPLDPDWNGSNGITNLPFKDVKIEWCKSWVTKIIPNEFAKSYRLMVTSDEQGANTQNCHPLLISKSLNSQCVDTDVRSDSANGEVSTFYPKKGRNDFDFFTRNRTYVWKLKTCYDDTSSQCGAYGQAWKLSTKNDTIGAPEPIAPKHDPQGSQPIGLPVSLSWTAPDGANSFIYQTTFITGEQKTGWAAAPNANDPQSLKSSYDAENIKADTVYKWRVKACSQFNSQDCDPYSDWFIFRTTGRPPKPESMAQTAGIPKTFSWEAIPGAKSYIFSLYKSELESATTTLNSPEALANPKHTVGYPDIDQGQTYNWKIKTCAHADGTVCGEWSNSMPFTTDPLSPATTTIPEIIYTRGHPLDISWSEVSGAEAYHYTLRLVSTTQQGCVQETIEKTVARAGDTVMLRCLGNYELSVYPCVDPNCQSKGPTTTTRFVLAADITNKKSALMVCGTEYDLPETLWNEMESCQPKHIFIAGKIGLDFAIFKLALILLPLLILATALIFYSSFNNPGIWSKIKSMWKAVGIGLALLIFSWTIVGLILQAIGYPGTWWKIM